MADLCALHRGRRGDPNSNRRRACRGQGMVEYLLVLAVVIATTVGAMKIVSGAAADLTDALAENIESVTGVEDPGAAAQ